MRIIGLREENFKRIQIVELTPKGHVITIGGKNTQGKTSLMDGIMSALRGADYSPAVAIRRGAESARVKVTLGTEKVELNVERVFRRTKEGEVTTSVRVTTPDGAEYKGSQRVLDALLGDLAFDPLQFFRMKPRDQFDALKGFVKGFDFAANERDNQTDFGLRTSVNRQAKEARIAASQVPVPDNTPEEPIDETPLLDELQKAADHNSEIEQRKTNRRRLEAEIEGRQVKAQQLRDEADELLRRAAKLQEDADGEDAAVAAIKAKLAAAAAIPDPIDTTEVRDRLNLARAANLCVQQLKRRQAMEENAARLEAQADVLTKQMDERAAAKRAAIAAAEMPVPGLDFGDNEVLLNGFPLEQASAAERLALSVSLAMAMNPKLRVLLIRDASLLDEDSVQIIANLAEKHDYQVWMEVVRTDGAVGFVLENGMLKAANEAAEDAA